MDPNGEPRHHSGLVPGGPGLYFVGLHFLHALSSTMIHGVGRDAARVAGTIAARTRDAAASVPVHRNRAAPSMSGPVHSAGREP
jgi:putative flavoprotein involved in K+ transport